MTAPTGTTDAAATDTGGTPETGVGPEDASDIGANTEGLESNDRLQQFIQNTRDEVKQARAKAAEAVEQARQDITEQVRQELTQQFGRALGLVKDGDEVSDPSELTRQLGEKDSKIRELTIKSALSDALMKANARPIARAAILGDGILNDLDVTAKDFAAQVEAKVLEYVEKNDLKTTRTPGASGADHPGGSGDRHDPAANARPGVARLEAAYGATPA